MFSERSTAFGSLLTDNPAGNRHAELYAAQQALEWALEPDCIKSPFQMINGTRKAQKVVGGSRSPSVLMYLFPKRLTETTTWTL